MKNDVRFTKALYLLDAGRVVEGEALVREVLATSEVENDGRLNAAARCVLGELLLAGDRSAEAEAVLLPIASIDEYDDARGEERRIAIDLLKQLRRE